MFRRPRASGRQEQRDHPATEDGLSDETHLLATTDVEVDRAVAFERLSGEHLEEAYRLAFLILRDAQEAEDATHDAFVRAWRDYGRLRDPERFDAWFRRILVNACRDHLRRGRYRRHDDLDRAVAAASPDDAHRTLIERDALEGAFRRLSTDHRIAIVLRYYRDLTAEQIAHAVGAPVGTVRSRLHHALKQLRGVLELEDPDR